MFVFLHLGYNGYITGPLSEWHFEKACFCIKKCQVRNGLNMCCVDARLSMLCLGVRGWWVGGGLISPREHVSEVTLFMVFSAR